MKSKLVGTCLLLLAAACQSTSTPAPRAPGLDVVFMQLKTGPRPGPMSKEEATGHIGNIKRLAAAGQLYVAGPYGAPPRDPELRGVFILAPEDCDDAQALAATDPAIAAGVFRTECVRMRTRAPLKAYIEHELAIEARDKAAGVERKLGEGMRSYVWLTAEHGRRARQALLEVQGILLWGDFADGRAIALFDAKDPAACTALLGEHAREIGPYVLDPWYASGELVRMPEMARAAASP